MKPILPGLLLVVSTVFGGVDTPADIAGQPILDAVVAHLPMDALEIHGDITVRKRRGVVLQQFKFDMALNWGAVPSSASYTIRDGFGKVLESLSIQRSKTIGVRVAYRVGDDDGAPRSLPLYTRIQKTDISWADLTLAFLWWPDSKVVGEDKIRGRDCFVLEVPAPADETVEKEATAAEASTGLPYASVRIWIDREMLMLLQAEGLNAKGKPIRKLWVKSLKKIDGQWLIKDMEIQSFPPIHRTRLRIREVSAAAAS